MNIRAYSTLTVWLMLVAVASAQAIGWPYYTSDLGGTKYSPAAQIVAVLTKQALPLDPCT